MYTKDGEGDGEGAYLEEEGPEEEWGLGQVPASPWASASSVPRSGKLCRLRSQLHGFKAGLYHVPRVCDGQIT